RVGFNPLSTKRPRFSGAFFFSISFYLPSILNINLIECSLKPVASILSILRVCTNRTNDDIDDTEDRYHDNHPHNTPEHVRLPFLSPIVAFAIANELDNAPNK